MLIVDNIICYGVIYKITNLVNGKCYIGQTTLGFDRRYSYNLLKNTTNIHLKRSIEKYGIENFDICKIFDYAMNKYELDEKERYYIDYYNSISPLYGYNRKEGGSSGKMTHEQKEEISKRLKEKFKNKENHPMYGKHHTEEWKQEQSERMSGENHPFYGKHHSKETKEKLRNANIGEKNPMFGRCDEKHPFYGKHHSEGTKKKISESHKGKTCSEETKKKLSKSRKGKRIGKDNPMAKSVICLNEKKIFTTIKEASEFSGADMSSIIKCCKGKQKTALGFTWKYLIWKHNKKFRIKNKGDR